MSGAAGDIKPLLAFKLKAREFAVWHSGMLHLMVLLPSKITSTHTIRRGTLGRLLLDDPIDVSYAYNN